MSFLRDSPREVVRSEITEDDREINYDEINRIILSMPQRLLNDAEASSFRGRLIAYGMTGGEANQFLQVHQSQFRNSVTGVDHEGSSVSV